MTDKTWQREQRACWQALGMVQSLIGQSDLLYDHLLSEDRNLMACYDALVEALEALERQLQRLSADDEDDLS